MHGPIPDLNLSLRLFFQCIEKLEIAQLVLFSLLLAHAGFAEYINSEGKVISAKFCQYLKSFLSIFTNDELWGEEPIYTSETKW